VNGKPRARFPTAAATRGTNQSPKRYWYATIFNNIQSTARFLKFLTLFFEGDQPTRMVIDQVIRIGRNKRVPARVVPIIQLERSLCALRGRRCRLCRNHAAPGFDLVTLGLELYQTGKMLVIGAVAQSSPLDRTIYSRSGIKFDSDHFGAI